MIRGDGTLFVQLSIHDMHAASVGGGDLCHEKVLGVMVLVILVHFPPRQSNVNSSFYLRAAVCTVSKNNPRVHPSV